MATAITAQMVATCSPVKGRKAAMTATHASKKAPTRAGCKDLRKLIMILLCCHEVVDGPFASEKSQ